MSKEFCGTPGPWVNNNGGVFTEDYAVGDEVFFDHICDCEVINGESHNAQLISAAPEMLESLQEMVGSLGVMVKDPENCHEIIKARAAIAKALGKKQ
ncbi:hypothetical protein V7I42_22255 [Raoultella ornithinolytica]|uniref:hypothetical protein n=1 Tax=Raoultella ornithinolytica TaxID=54291 RepID=UPI002FEFDB1B